MFKTEKFAFQDAMSGLYYCQGLLSVAVSVSAANLKRQVLCHWQTQMNNLLRVEKIAEPR